MLGFSNTFHASVVCNEPGLEFADSIEKAEPAVQPSRSYRGPSAGCTAVVALVSFPAYLHLHATASVAILAAAAAGGSAAAACLCCNMLYLLFVNVHSSCCCCKQGHPPPLPGCNVFWDCR